MRHWWNNEVTGILLLQGLHQKTDNASYSSRKKKALGTSIFLELFTQRKFHLLLKYLHFFDNEIYDEVTCSSRRLYKLERIELQLAIENYAWSPEWQV
jgi:hypothetical protein